MKMKRRWMNMLPYLLSYAALFFLVPIVSMLDPYSAETGLLVYMLYIFNPAITFVLNIIYCIRHGLVWYFPLFGGILFAPSIVVYYNQTAIVYIFAYIVLGYIGMAAGYSMLRNKEQED